MIRTRSDDALLKACIEDLYAGKRLLVRHLPRLISKVGDPTLKAQLADMVTLAATQSERLRATGLAGGGPANLWMAGILDDALRDARSIAPGLLLDVALIGAMRKALAAEIVSDDTALALADAMDRAEVRDAVAAIQAEERASEQALAARLGSLAQAAASLPSRGHGETGKVVVGAVALGAASVGSWFYWMRQDRAHEKRTHERLASSERR